MRFLIDNALSSLVAEGLRRNGHDAVHVRDIGMETASDERIFDLAQDEDRIVVSADTDFGALPALREQGKPSLVLFRRGTDRRPVRQLALLVANLPRLEQPLADGCIAVLEEARIRLRMLPIASDDRE